MYVITEMSLEGREKLSKLIKTLVARHKSRRSFARNLGVSPSAVINWEEMVSVPDTENLVKIANQSGYTLSELQEMIDGKASQNPTTVERVIYEIQQLNSRDIAKVIEAAAGYMVRTVTEA